MATMLVLPADHLIQNHAEFQRVLTNAALAAENSGSLVTIGIKPTWPCPSYGYVERGRKASIGGVNDLPVWEVARFREKPNPDLAEHFISQGNFLWNAGMFIWTIPAIFSELSRHCPRAGRFHLGTAWFEGFQSHRGKAVWQAAKALHRLCLDGKSLPCAQH
jgi:mannose-1-phosphate guanylyltransferase